MEEGLYVEDFDKVEVYDSTFNSNELDGVYTTETQFYIENCNITGNLKQGVTVFSYYNYYQEPFLINNCRFISNYGN